jgi:hypothetical protein
MTLQEKGGEVAGTAINALKGNPLCLAVVILTIVLSVIAYMRESAQGAGRQAVITSLIERCMEPAKR